MFTFYRFRWIINLKTFQTLNTCMLEMEDIFSYIWILVWGWEWGLHLHVWSVFFFFSFFFSFGFFFFFFLPEALRRSERVTQVMQTHTESLRESREEKEPCWWKSEEWAGLGTCCVRQDGKLFKLIQWEMILSLVLMLYIWMDGSSDHVIGLIVQLDPIASICQSWPLVRLGYFQRSDSICNSFWMLFK